MFKQYELPFASDALEPAIDALTVETHHGKHHVTYTKAFNEAAEKAGMADMDVEELLASLDKVEDPALQKALRNNGGGYYNHNLYFSTITPGGKAPTAEFKALIDETFGSQEELIAQLTALATGQFGSGWAWLNADKDGKLSVSNSPNQDNPISEGKGCVPILAVDVWEHAYYLKYRNLRPDYIKALFTIINWEAVEANYKRVAGK